MRKKSVIVISLMLFLVIFPLVSSLDTFINVISNPNDVITVKLQDPDSGKTLVGHSYDEFTIDDSGKYKITFTSDIQNKLKIAVRMKSKMQTYAWLDDVKTGWEYDLLIDDGNPILNKLGLSSGEPIPVVEESSSNNELPEENSDSTDTDFNDDSELTDAEKALLLAKAKENSKSKSENIEEPIKEEIRQETKKSDITEEIINNPVTGAVIGGPISFKGIIYFGIGFVIIIALLLTFVFLKKAQVKKDTYVHFKFKGTEEEKIADAEKKIKQAEDEIKKAEERTGF